MPSGVLGFPDISDVYARYAALTELSADVGGCLLLYAELNPDGIALAMASNVAGAASLGLEPDAARAKAALRAGVCDFVVNDLSEALRILKNEIRKRQTVSVVLTADPEAALAEMIERGVQPEVLAFSVPEMVERGARVLNVDTAEVYDKEVQWGTENEPLRWVPVLDELAAQSIGGGTSSLNLRVRWLKASPRYLGRKFSGQRYLRMTESEVDTFVEAVRAAIRSRTVPVSARVKLTRSGEEILWRPRAPRQRTESPPRRL